MSPVKYNKCRCGRIKDLRAHTCAECYYNRSSRPCTGCGGKKENTGLRVRSRGIVYARSRCRKCEARYAREYCHRMPRSILNARSRGWERRNPSKVRRMRIRARARIAGIPIQKREQIVNLVLNTKQCTICHRTTDEVGTLHIDHCHDGGRFRGLLCGGCNTGLGQFGDDPDRLELAAEYLRRHQRVVISRRRIVIKICPKVTRGLGPICDEMEMV